jgi:mannonate dehydratase
LPLYELFGGAVRDRVDVYRYADGSSIQEVINAAKAKVAAGLRYVRCQLGGYGGTAVPGDDRVRIDPKRYMATAVEMLQEARRALGPDIEIIHDIHERLPLAEIARFARRIEELGLFFLEDPVPPDHVERLRDLRRAVTTPIALGELFTTPEQWREIIAEQLIDYIRVHVSHIGGITPARKLAALAEAFGVRTAWHGPGDCSPFGHAANLHLDLAAPNFGIQEYYTPQPVVHEIFPGTPEVVDGALIAPTGPGLGIGFNEERAKEFPPALEPPRWTRTRSPDGTLVWP